MRVIVNARSSSKDYLFIACIPRSTVKVVPPVILFVWMQMEVRIPKGRFMKNCLGGGLKPSRATADVWCELQKFTLFVC